MEGYSNPLPLPVVCAFWPWLRTLYLLAIGPTTCRQLSAMGAFLDKFILSGAWQRCSCYLSLGKGAEKRSSLGWESTVRHPCHSTDTKHQFPTVLLTNPTGGSKSGGAPESSLKGNIKKTCLWQTGIVGIRLMRLASHFDVSPQIVGLVDQCGLLVVFQWPRTSARWLQLASGQVVDCGVSLCIVGTGLYRGFGFSSGWLALSLPSLSLAG